MAKNTKIEVRGTEIIILKEGNQDFISLTDMLKAKDGDSLSLTGLETVIQ